MTATLTVTWNEDPTGIGAAYHDMVQRSVQNAFAAWRGHFDVSSGNLGLTVNFVTLGPSSAASAGPSALTPVGTTDGTTAAKMSSFGSEIGFGSAQGSTGAVLNIDTSWLVNTFPTAAHPQAPFLGDDTRVFEHELGHALGLISLRNLTTGAISNATESTYDQYIQVSGGAAVFTGPNAMAQFGGPVPLEVGAGFHPFVGGKISVMSYTDWAQSIQTLDVDLLKDAGLPILTGREVDEHMVARLYVAAFNRAADPAGLVNWTRQLAAGASLDDVAAGFLGAPEFALRYGSDPSNQALVDQLYTQALHRAPDAAGEASWVAALNGGESRADVVAGFSESDENRQALSAATNISYSATVEEEVARLYATAFLRGADPSGFSTWTQALINGDSLGQVAAQFIQSPEFAAHYGSSVSNDAFVAAMYTNTLGRAPDASGEASWISELSSGLSRADMLVGFSDSAEHIRDMAATAVVGTAGDSGLVDVPLGMIPTHAVGSLV
jgi:hypothetical protein